MFTPGPPHEQALPMSAPASASDNGDLASAEAALQRALVVVQAEFDSASSLLETVRSQRAAREAQALADSASRGLAQHRRHASPAWAGTPGASLARTPGRVLPTHDTSDAWHGEAVQCVQLLCQRLQDACLPIDEAGPAAKSVDSVASPTATPRSAANTPKPRTSEHRVLQRALIAAQSQVNALQRQVQLLTAQLAAGQGGSPVLDAGSTGSGPSSGAVTPTVEPGVAAVSAAFTAPRHRQAMTSTPSSSVSGVTDATTASYRPSSLRQRRQYWTHDTAGPGSATLTPSKASQVRATQGYLRHSASKGTPRSHHKPSRTPSAKSASRRGRTIVFEAGSPVMESPEVDGSPATRLLHSPVQRQDEL